MVRLSRRGLHTPPADRSFQLNAGSPRATSGYGAEPSQQISPEHGGLWLPMPSYDGQRSYLVHYSAAKLSAPALPAGPRGIDVESVAQIPGSTEQLGEGFTHASGNPGVNVTAVILQYGS